MSDPITATIVAFTKIAAAVVKAYKAYKIVRIAVMVASAVAVSAVAKAMTPKGAPRLDQGQEIALKLDPTMPRQVAVGRTTTGGSLVWAFTYTDPGAADNAYLVRIIALSDRPIEGVVAILEGKQQLEFSGDIYTIPAPCTIHKVGEVPYMWVHVIKGYDNMTSLGYLQDWSGGRWTPKHKGVGIAYAVVKYLYNADAYPNGEPQLQFILDGARVYDDRESEALGGNQHPGDQVNWQFSRNPATIAAQFLRGFKTHDSLILGGQIEAEDLDPEIVIAAANTCDEEEELEAGGTEPRYRAGMMLTSSNSIADELDQLRLAMDGQVFDRGGGIALLPGGTRTPVMVLDDNDVNWSEEKSFQPIASLSSLYNHVQGSYAPEDLDFTQESYPIRTDPAYVVQDGGEKIVLQQDFRAVGSSSQIQRITARILASSRFQMTIGFVGPLWLLELEQGDWFTMSSTRWMFEEKTFVVQSRTITSDLKVTIVATETSTTVSGWLPADEVPRTTTETEHLDYSLPIPDLTLAPLAYKNADDVEVPAIVYDLTVPIGSATQGFDLQIRRLGEVVSRQLPRIGLNDAHGQVANMLLPATEYQLRARSTDDRLYGEWCTWESVTTTGNLISTDTQNVGKFTTKQIEQKIDDFDATVAEVEALSTAVAELDLLIDGEVSTLNAAVSTAMDEVREGAYATIMNSVARGRELAMERERSYVNGVHPSAWYDHIITITDGLASSHTMLGAEVEGNKATYDAFVLTQATTNSALAESLETLTVTVGDNAAEVTDFMSAQADTNKSTATSISDLTTTVGTNKSDYEAFVIAQTSENASLAAATTKLSSDFSTYQSTVSSTYATKSDVTGSIASYDSTIKAWSVDDTGGGSPLAAYVTSQATALATAEGQLYASAGLTTTAGGVVTGLSIFSSSGATPLSAIVMRAANFLFEAAPGSGSTVTPWSYDSGTGKMFAEDITMRRGNIQGAAISTTLGFTSIGSTTVTTSLTAVGGTQTVYADTGADIVITAFLYAENTDTTSGQDVTVAILKDGIFFEQKIFHIDISNQNSVCWPTTDLNVTGTHTYSIVATATPGSGSHCKATQASLVLTVLFKTGI